MDDFAKQVEEIEALKAIYENEWQIEDEENRAYSISINDGNNHVTLYIKIPPNYPSMSPPIYEISAPHLSKAIKIYLGRVLENVYLSSIGQTVIFQWIEKVREELQQLSNKSDQCHDEKDAVEYLSTSSAQQLEEIYEKCPDITHGEIIIDRKSTFQGHVAVVTSETEVEVVLKKLKDNKKIANATHNVYAYRICKENENTFLFDSEDDGESQAGSRLMRFLELTDVKNVLVVVSRWYGGIHIGPDRFKHIINAARQVLIMANLMPQNKIPHKKY